MVLVLCFAVTAEAFVPRFKARALNGRVDTRNGPSPFELYATIAPMPTDDEMSDWLDDMVFSGDLEGFLMREQNKLLSEDFIDYVDERVEQAEDEDEKGAFQEVLSLLESRRKATDGNAESGVAFEARLDKILFTAPNKRLELIKEELADEITEGFIGYVQDEMKESGDSDAKVVYASILKLIGEAKGTDFLGSSASVLAGADKSLGDQFAKPESFLASGDGLLEAANDKTAIGDDRNEQILASLTFSTNDILEDVLNNLHEIDDRFTDYLENKIDKCRDFEEKEALSSLYEVVKYVLEKVATVQGEDPTVVEEELSIDAVKQRMQEVQSGQQQSGNGAQQNVASSAEFMVTKDADSTFRSILSRFEGIYEKDQLEEAVSKNYELCDMNFLNMLKNEIQVCKDEGADIEAQQLEALENTIRAEMTGRLSSAQSKLDAIISKNSVGGVKAMESECVRLVRKGLADEALILLMEANQQQAAAAGSPAANVLKMLIDRIQEEKSKDLPDEQKLLRVLMKIEDSEKRKEVLYEHFSVQKSMDNDGVVNEGAPLVSPPLFINVVKSFAENFGNVEDFSILEKLQPIIDDAQAVATDLYGEGMSPRDHQKLMYEKNTMSVWDLENFEQMAEMSGEEIPWANDKYDGMNPEDVLGNRVKSVGGDDDMSAVM